MRTRWFTSDLHFGHEKVAELRGYSSAQEHDEALSEEWWRRVRPHDQVFVLGDLSINWKRGLDAVRDLPGEKHLILGNHDGAHPMHRDAYIRQSEALTVFDSAQTAQRLKYDGMEYLLSHFPYTGDTPKREEDRHVQWRLCDEGVPIVHGHVHSVDTATRSAKGTPQYHVGWDAHGSLVDNEEIVAWLGAVS